MSTSPRRRLAAIVAADVAHYSRLVGLDEEGTIADLRACRGEVIDPALARHRGRVANTAGDSLLIEFASVVDAVRCAAEIQQGMADRTATEPADRRIAFRIGIHVGDVLAQGDGEAADLLGDGVNIAARIEALCVPGGILLSDAAHSQVRDRLDHTFHDAGEHRVKNIARPVRVWRWSLGDEAEARVATDPSPQDRPSIAVLAFNNLSGDPEQTYFAEGIAEDIITDLSKVSGLFVIARNSSFAYRRQSPNIRAVCRDLGVRYVLEGSVRKAGNRIRINAQLIEGATGGHVWADRFDRDLADIFAVQDEVTGEIVGALKVTLTLDEQDARASRRPVDPEAYDLMLRGREFLMKFNEDSARQARMLIEQAIARDPDFSTAHATLSLLHCTEYLNGWNDVRPDHLDTAMALADKAAALDPNDSDAWHAMGLARLWTRDYVEAERAAERAIAARPGHAGAIGVLGQVQDFTGRHAAALDCAERALLLDPRYHVLIQLKGRALFGLQRYEEAAAAFEERLRHMRSSDTSRAFLAGALGHLERHEEAARHWAETMEINPKFSLTRLRETLPYTTPDVLDRLARGLTAAGIEI